MPSLGNETSIMGTDVWLTPPSILSNLGEFDLDPCSPIDRPWDTAKTHYTIIDDGLSKEWSGRVWMNPPYGKALGVWLEKLAMHGNGIALIFARTEIKAFQKFVFPYADGFLFISGRINFHTPDGVRCKNPSGAPSVLIAYGTENFECLKYCGISGAIVSNEYMRSK